MKNLFVLVAVLLTTCALNSCEKGDYKCTCVNADDELSHQSTMSGPKTDMEEACANFEGGGGNQGNGDNVACTLTEQ